MASLQGTTEPFPGVRTGRVPAPTITSDTFDVNAGAGVDGARRGKGHQRRRSSWSELGF